MTLLTQFRCLYYSFCFGIFMMFVFCIVNRIFLRYRFFLCVSDGLIGVFLGYIYYIGLVCINTGILRVYDFILLLLGYMMFMRYYRLKWMFSIEKVVKYVNKIISCILFFFVYNNVIMRWIRRVKKDGKE